jgi:hypothetical protein
MGHFAVRPKPSERAWVAMPPSLLAGYRAGEAEKASARIEALAAEVPKEEIRGDRVALPRRGSKPV